MILAGKFKMYRPLVLWASVVALGTSSVTLAQTPTKPDSKALTTDTGRPVGENTNSLTAGAKGPILLEHFFLLEKLARFDRERIGEQRQQAAEIARRIERIGIGESGRASRRIPALEQ